MEVVLRGSLNDIDPEILFSWAKDNAPESYLQLTRRMQLIHKPKEGKATWRPEAVRLLRDSQNPKVLNYFHQRLHPSIYHGRLSETMEGIGAVFQTLDVPDPLRDSFE